MLISDLAVKMPYRGNIKFGAVVFFLNNFVKKYEIFISKKWSNIILALPKFGSNIFNIWFLSDSRI